jgi:hypothetical protein
MRSKNFLIKVLRSRTAILLQFCHLIALVLVIYDRGFITTVIHPENESIALIGLYVVDLPALLIAVVLSIPFNLILSKMWFENIQFIIAFILVQLQWAMIGFWIEKFIKRRRNQ